MAFNILSKLRREPSDDELREFIRQTQANKARVFIENSLMNGIKINKFTDYDSYLKAGCKNVWATFRACHAVASVIMGTDFHLEQYGEMSDRVEDDDELYKFLRRPNPYDSWNEMLYLWTFHIKLTGCAYWLKDERNLLGQPDALYPLLPQYMRLEASKEVNISKFIYRVNGKEIEYDPEEIIYFRRPNPRDLMLGLGDVEPSEAIYNEHINRNTYNEQFMENGAQPSGVMTFKGEDAPEQVEWERMKKDFERKYSGKDNAGKVAFLTGEWDYHQLGLSQQQMQGIERETLNMKTIFLNHGVPLSIVGLGSANRATATVEELNFRKYEIVPLLEMFIGKMNAPQQGLFPFYDESRRVPARLSYNLSGLIDVQQVMNDYKPLVEMGGMTLNELREMAGLKRVANPYLDQYFIGSGRIPIEMAGLADIPPDQISTDNQG